MTPLELIQTVRDIKSQPWTQINILASLSEALTAFVSQRDNQRIIVSGKSTGLYTRLLLNASADGFQIVIVLWKPHSKSPIHDHNETLGAVATLVGCVQETKYQVLCTDHQTACLTKLDTISLRDNHVTPILPDAVTQLHDMHNDTDEWAATVHVYLKPLKHYQIYESVPGSAFKIVSKELWFDTDNAWKFWTAPDLSVVKTQNPI